MNIVSPSLKAKDLYYRLKKFGFTHVSPLKKLKQNRHKQICSKGYGIQTNPLELKMAYQIFSFPCDVIKKEAAKKIRKLIIEAIKKGTGKNAQLKGMVIGGKTGTSRMINKKIFKSIQCNIYRFYKR